MRDEAEARSEQRGKAPLRDELVWVRDLIAHDELDEALNELRRLVEGGRTEFDVELINLRRRLSEIETEQRKGTVTREQAEADKSKFVADLLRLVEALQGHPRRRPASEDRARAHYLRYVEEDVANRLKVSIHNARFIDLGIDATPEATHLPWVYRDPDSHEEFDTVDQAFASHRRRLLLLGSPGSGKTTTLLHLAHGLIAEARRDPDALVPLVVNLSQFHPESHGPSLLARWRRRDRERDRRDRRLEQWLIGELTRRPGVSAEAAHAWIEGDRVAVLMDGLDEVDIEYRATLARLLNETFLRDYPDAVVVVCSRINEYSQLMDVKETRLQLDGAVTLQPLTEDQIKDYLAAAHATGLGAALPNDAALYEMAQTPLTLSMMTLAYSGLAPSDIPSDRPLTERRHHLMEAYVTRMLQRKERRDRDIPFDQNRDNDVKERDYAYPPERVNRYLGWLAVRLSVRMQTAVSMSRFYSFLTKEIERDRQWAVSWGIAIAQVVVAFLAALAVGASIAPRRFDGLLHVPMVALFLSILGVSTLRAAEGLADDVIGFIASILAAIAGFGVVSRALVAVVPGGWSPYPTGVIAICAS